MRQWERDRPVKRKTAHIGRDRQLIFVLKRRLMIGKEEERIHFDAMGAQRLAAGVDRPQALDDDGR